MYRTGFDILFAHLSLERIILYAVFIFVCWILYYVLTMYTPWKINLIVGKKGSGKSTYAAAIMLKYINAKVLEYSTECKCWNLIPLTIYTNMHVMIPGVRYIKDADKLGKYIPPPYSVLLLDEVNTIPGWDNRDFKDTPKELIEFFRYCRQHRVILYCFTQSYDIDKKARSQTDRVSLCKKVLGVFTMIRKIDKWVDIDTNRLDADQQIVDQIKFAPWWIPGNVKFLWIPKYTSFFNSYNPPVKPYFNYIVETPVQIQENKIQKIQKLIPRHKRDVV